MEAMYEVDIDTATDLSAKVTTVYQAIEDKKGESPVVLDLRGLSSVTDILVVCNGHSDRHVQALAENIQVEMKKQGALPLGVEGLKAGSWILLDYEDVIVHVFYEPVRTFYDLEGIWSDAPRLKLVDGMVVCA
jgi:ribosome-associated protein